MCVCVCVCVCVCSSMQFYPKYNFMWGFPGGVSGREPACQCRTCRRCGFDPYVRKILWRRVWQHTLVLLPGESHGQSASWAKVYGVAKSGTRLKWPSTHAHTKLHVHTIAIKMHSCITHNSFWRALKKVQIHLSTSHHSRLSKDILSWRSASDITLHVARIHWPPNIPL